jgi:hypothetical protein
VGHLLVLYTVRVLSPSHSPIDTHSHAHELKSSGGWTNSHAPHVPSYNTRRRVGEARWAGGAARNEETAAAAAAGKQLVRQRTRAAAVGARCVYPGCTGLRRGRRAGGDPRSGIQHHGWLAALLPACLEPTTDPIPTESSGP